MRADTFLWAENFVQPIALHAMQFVLFRLFFFARVVEQRRVRLHLFDAILQHLHNEEPPDFMFIYLTAFIFEWPRFSIPFVKRMRMAIIILYFSIIQSHGSDRKVGERKKNTNKKLIFLLQQTDKQF